MAEAMRVLAANGGNAKKTAAQLDIPRSTIRYWAGRSNSHGFTPSPLQLPAQRDVLAERWKAVAERGTGLALAALEGIQPADLSARDVKDLLVGSAVATEKHLLLTGHATSRSETVHISLVGANDLRSSARQVLESVPVTPELTEPKP